MALDVSHSAFSGAYSSLRRLCRCVAEATGGRIPHGGAVQWGEGFGPATHPGLDALLVWLNLVGWIKAQRCALVADELSALLPRIEAMR